MLLGVNALLPHLLKEKVPLLVGDAVLSGLLVCRLPLKVGGVERVNLIQCKTKAWPNENIALVIVVFAVLIC